jgi:hypothetical protein
MSPLIPYVSIAHLSLKQYKSYELWYALITAAIDRAIPVPSIGELDNRRAKGESGIA